MIAEGIVVLVRPTHSIFFTMHRIGSFTGSFFVPKRRGESND